MPLPLKHTHIKPGKRYGSLEALTESYIHNGRRRVDVRCDCGKTITVQANNLYSGNTESCGCYRKNDRQIRTGPSYRLAHTRVRRKRGSPRTYRCECGDRADHWAYQYTDNDELFEPGLGHFSLSAEHYKAMCESCHQRMDQERRDAQKRGPSD